VAAGTSAAPAASSPAVVTGKADGITQSGAHPDGTVNPNGSSTTYHFEGGPATGYGVSHSAESAGSGTKSVSVSQTATGLSPGKMYHFRLVATRPRGADAWA